MTEMMIEISTYLVVAILLGYIFGWLTNRAMRGEKLKGDFVKRKEEELGHINEVLSEVKSLNTTLLSDNNKILLENRKQKLKIHQLVKMLKKRDENVEELQEHIKKQKYYSQQKLKKHELEIEAFIEERRKIIEQFKSTEL